MLFYCTRLSKNTYLYSYACLANTPHDETSSAWCLVRKKSPGTYILGSITGTITDHMAVCIHRRAQTEARMIWCSHGLIPLARNRLGILSFISHISRLAEFFSFLISAIMNFGIGPHCLLPHNYTFKNTHQFFTFPTTFQPLVGTMLKRE
jgi:hypothetical protein